MLQTFCCFLTSAAAAVKCEQHQRIQRCRELKSVTKSVVLVTTEFKINRGIVRKYASFGKTVNCYNLAGFKTN